MKRQRKPKFYSYSSIELCTSCYAGNGDKGNANITYCFSCTWQAPNRTTAARTSLLWEVWETDRHGWKLVPTGADVHDVQINAFAFQKWLQACKLFVIPYKVPKYSSLSSIKYTVLDECKIWGISLPTVVASEATAVGREMWTTYNAVCIIIHQGLENVETFSSRPRPRPLFMSSRRLETKTKDSRLHIWNLEIGYVLIR